MHILITGADTSLGRALAAHLEGRHTLRVADSDADLRHPQIAADLVAGVDAVAHLALYTRAEPANASAERELLDRAARGTFVLQHAALAAGVTRIVLASRLELVAGYPAGWVVDETWKPQPAADAASLAPYLAELTLREFVRAEPLHATALRFGALDGREAPYTRAADALQALERALTAPAGPRGYRWGLYHIDSSGRYPLDAARAESLALEITPDAFSAPPEPTTSAPAPPPGRNPAVTGGALTVFGAGGPVGAVAARALKEQYTLHLTDVRPLAEIGSGEPQSPGAPLPEPPQAPHTEAVVDIADYEAVLEASRGRDALVNVSVVRRDPPGAFDVNMVGAYNVAKAAVACGIRRIVHTGPYHMSLNHAADYWWDHEVPDDAPLHPGGDLYALSKFLGGEITRIFAERHALSVITFLYCHFMPGDGGEQPDGGGCGPFVTGWEDCGAAFPHALRVGELPRPYEPFLICAPAPQRKFPADKAKRLLGWEARDRFERLWQR